MRLTMEAGSEMKSAWAIFGLLACLTAAHAQVQNGVSNARDANGNLVHNNGVNPTRGLTRSLVNNPGRPDNRPAAVAAPRTRPDNGAVR
jgi:hypothetical protein